MSDDRAEEPVAAEPAERQGGGVRRSEHFGAVSDDRAEEPVAAEPAERQREIGVLEAQRSEQLSTVRRFQVRVPGGELTVHELAGDPDSDQVILALHGITANGLSMRPLARAVAGRAPQIRVLAPDLAGRACSAAVTGPWGIGRHAEDVIAIADAVGARTVHLLGHSMGAYVAAVAAARHPQRVDRVVLVDGGVAFPLPPGTDVDALLTAVIGPAMTRLSMTFPDLDAYLGFMAANPAVGGILASGDQAADDLRSYLAHDAVHRPDGTVASSCVRGAIRVDGGAVLSEPETLRAAGTLAIPARLLWAPRGLMDQTPGLLTAEMIAAANLPDTVTVEQVPDCNHYSIMFADHALAAVVDAVLG